MSYNLNNGLDFQLKILGIEDREHWEILSRDDLEYRNRYVVCRPDWALHNICTGEYRVIDYKSRPLGRGKPTVYEMTQVVINAIVVRDHIEAERGVKVNVVAELVFGDQRIYRVEYTGSQADWLMRQAYHLAPELYRRGSLPKRDSLIPASTLAKLIEGDFYSNNDEEARKAGVQAHYAIINHGPQPGATPGETLH